MRLHKLKMNPAKCVFRVQAGDFLGFIVHQWGIEVPDDKANALQGQNEFVWEPKHQEAFDRIKAYLASPPVLVPPRAGFSLKLYISAAEASIGNLLAQVDEEGVEHAILYISRTLIDCETRFGIPEVLISNKGAAFMGGDVEKFINELGIQFVHSTPYYAQSNGQAEASNKIVITL
ncbi:uncharacterized protein LOC112199102 [Rosa chinensis]|uniref:uncharacterized protein LOC112199102 n=1 Tax=Rosa chinensis TaxID=74649 RepID=UPI000D0866DD|nr:uncharacterized protein LOC112199102 [Rosa chinensis]